MEEAKYKDYIIRATPHRLADGSGWTSDLIISKSSGSGVTEKQYHPAQTFSTEAEAVKGCFFFAREIIDGKYPKVSLPD